MDEELFFKPAPETNSIAIIVNHMSGNMASRWKGFLTSYGEKEWRQRDREFEEGTKTRKKLLDRWEAGWKLVFQALEQVNKDNFDQLVYIHNQGDSIVIGVNHQL